jgi:hemerythrin-like domain-containing protein
MLAPVATAPQADDGLFDFLDQFHREILVRLDEMLALAVTLEADGLTPAARDQARRLKDWFSAEARQHHLDEERHVFPGLLASADAEIRQATHRLIQDHGWLEADWLEIEPSLSAAAEGNTWFDPCVLRHAVEVFRQLYIDHILLEESLAYPQAREHMDPTRLEAMGVEMARRRALRDVQGPKA